MESLNLHPNQTGFVTNRTNLAAMPKHNKYPFKAERLKSSGINAVQTNGHSGPSPYFEVIWIVRGSGRINFKSRSSEIEDNTMYSFSPGHCYILEPGERLTGYRISFSQEFLYMTGTETSILFLEENPSHSNTFHPLEVGEDIQPGMEEVMEAMVKEYRNNFEFRSQILKGLLRVFIIYFTRLSQENKMLFLKGTENNFFKRFTDLIKDSFPLKKTVS